MSAIPNRKKGETVFAYRKRCERYVENVSKTPKKKKASKNKNIHIFWGGLFYVGFVNGFVAALVFLILDSYMVQWSFGKQFILISFIESLSGFVLWRKL